VGCEAGEAGEAEPGEVCDVAAALCHGLHDGAAGGGGEAEADAREGGDDKVVRGVEAIEDRRPSAVFSTTPAQARITRAWAASGNRSKTRRARLCMTGESTALGVVASGR
jgi:hypothetical protein